MATNQIRAGFQTIAWGPRFHSKKELESALQLIKEYGFSGVEFSQRPDKDHLGVANLAELRELTEPLSLQVLGLSGGTLMDRMQFCSGDTSPFLLVYDWDVPFIELAVERFTIALHQRVFTKVSRLKKANQLLKAHDDLKIIIDTAHLTIAGDDPIEAITKWYSTRLIAVHFKDWTSRSERSSHRYARGFVPLGKGEVKLEAIVETLNTIRSGLWVERGRWITAELDNAYIPPEIAISESAAWLHSHNLLSSPPPSLTARSSTIFSDSRFRVPDIGDYKARASDTRFLATILDSIARPPLFYETIARAIYDLTQPILVHVWAYSPLQSPNSQMALLATYPTTFPNAKPEWSEPSIIALQDSLSGIAVDRQAAVTAFDLIVDKPGQRYGYPTRSLQHPSLKEDLCLRSMFAMPVFNSGNQNYTRLVINIFSTRNISSKFHIDYDRFSWVSRVITFAGDYLLDNRCDEARSSAHWLAQICRANHSDLPQYLIEIQRLICEMLPCQTAAIFLANGAQERLECMTPGTYWRPGYEPHYRRGPGQGTTASVWTEGEAFLTDDYRRVDGNRCLSWEIDPKEDLIRGTSRMWVPWYDSSNRVVGVVRCANKANVSAQAPRHLFSEDDVAIVDSIGQVVVPHIQLFQDEHRRMLLETIVHPLTRPLEHIRSIASKYSEAARMRKLPESTSASFAEPILAWSDFAFRVTKNINIFNRAFAGEPLRVRRSHVDICDDLLLPLEPALGLLLEDRQIPTTALECHAPANSKAFADRTMIQLALFNLVANATDYSLRDKSQIKIEVNVEIAPRWVIFTVADNGEGFRPDTANLAFRTIVRGPDSFDFNPEGRGIGLWVVKQIVDSHSGRVMIAKRGRRAGDEQTRIELSIPRDVEK